MYRMNGVNQEGSSNSWSSCSERVGTENKVSAGDLRGQTSSSGSNGDHAVVWYSDVVICVSVCVCVKPDAGQLIMGSANGRADNDVGSPAS